MVHSTMMFDAYLVVLLAEKDVLTDGLTDWQTDICISRAAFAAENGDKIIWNKFDNRQQNVKKQ